MKSALDLSDSEGSDPLELLPVAPPLDMKRCNEDSKPINSESWHELDLSGSKVGVTLRCVDPWPIRSW